MDEIFSIKFKLLIFFLILTALVTPFQFISASPKAETEWYAASDVENNFGWTDEDKMYDYDNQWAYADSDGENITLINFSIGDLTGMQIDGIEVKIRAVSMALDDEVLKICLLYDERNLEASKNYTTPPLTSNVNRTFGNATDTWGKSWTPTDFSDANFGILLIAYNVAVNEEANVDVVVCKIYYHDPAPEFTGITSILVIFLSLTIIISLYRLRMQKKRS